MVFHAIRGPAGKLCCDVRRPASGARVKLATGVHKGEPDEENQVRLFEQMLGTPTRRRGRPARRRTEKETVWARYRKLKDGASGLRIDPVYAPFLDSLLQYLSGETKGLVK
jgi:hypothetical protein